MVEKAIYLASTEEYAGKSIVAVSLALKSKDLGIKPGYFKPIGMETAGRARETVDEDVELMIDLLGLKGDPKIYSPITLRRDLFLEDFAVKEPSKYVDIILSAYEKASVESDLMLIEGASTLHSGAFLNCQAPHLSSKLKAEFLLISKFKNDHIVDEILQAREYASRWNVEIKGVIINKVPSGRIKRAKEVIKPFLEERGIEVLGIIPEDRILGAVQVREICEAVGGRVLAGEEGMDRLVEAVLVGAMTPESAMRYFQKAENELVITGGDRTDIVFAALEAGARAIILTGNLYPSVKIFPRADELKVPLILVPYDTYTTLQMVQRIVGKISPSDKKRIERAKKLVTENIMWKPILMDE